MSEAIFFVVERSLTGREQAALYHDHMPDRLTGKNAARDGLIYAVRVDSLPHGHLWLKMSLAQIYDAYCKARDGKTLPASNIASPAKASSDPAKILVGARREPFPRPWAGKPLHLPTPEDVDRRAAQRKR